MTKRKLVYVPIEPLEERYTEQWFHHFPKAFREAGYDVSVVTGTPLQATVKVGTFLDINSTVHYKMVQLQKIAKLFDSGSIENDTTFFFGDIEFWGIESVRLMSQMNRVPIKMAGFLHAASYTRGDAFEIAKDYQKYTELGWFACLNTVFVGSSYHRQAVIDRRLSLLPNGIASGLADRIKVVGNPLFESDYPTFKGVKKINQVVLTNRFDAEKEPGLTLSLFEAAKAAHPDWKFVVTTGRKTFTSNDLHLIDLARHLESKGVIEIRAGLTKNEYHHILAESKVMVSHSPEENFGYCIVEAALYKCQPLLRQCASHPELVHNSVDHLFSDNGAALEKLERLMVSNFNPQVFAAPYFKSPIWDIIEYLK